MLGVNFRWPNHRSSSHSADVLSVFCRSPRIAIGRDVIRWFCAQPIAHSGNCSRVRWAPVGCLLSLWRAQADDTGHSWRIQGDCQDESVSGRFRVPIRQCLTASSSQNTYPGEPSALGESCDWLLTARNSARQIGPRWVVIRERRDWSERGDGGVLWHASSGHWRGTAGRRSSMRGVGVCGDGLSKHHSGRSRIWCSIRPM